MKCDIENCGGQSIGEVTCWQLPDGGDEQRQYLCQYHADHLWQTTKGVIAAGLGGFKCVPLQENIQ